jgi:hydrogenase nickel incorporation protein HypA/HybF
VHELGLLASVVTAVSRAAADAGASSVEAVGLRVGTLSGAVPDALDGAWPIAIFGTALEGARLELEVIPAQVWCRSCDANHEVDEFYALRCPVCGTPTGALVHGREFEVAWADLE